MAETSKTADHALELLLELSKNGPRTPSDLANSLGLNRTVVYRLLATLHSRGFVLKAADGYAPGPVLVRMAERVQPALREAATGVMTQLTDASGETTVLHIPDGEDAVVTAQRVGTGNLVRVEHEIGSRHPLRLGASGRAILAYLPERTIAKVASRAPDPRLLREQLAQVQRDGWARTHDELQQGVHGIGVPIRRSDGRAVASLALIVPTNRDSALDANRDSLIAAADEIVRQLDSHQV
jgi:DNA-binding IclR family transcriptional regulator